MKMGRFLLTVLPAFVTGMLYTYYDFGILAWISLSPYFYLIIKRSADETVKPRRLYLTGLLFSFVYYSSVFYWFTYQYPLDFMGFSKAMSIAYVCLAWFGLSLLYSLTLALLPYATCRVSRTKLFGKAPYLLPVFIALFQSLVEWMHTKTFLGVPWCRLALTQQTILPNIQIASVLSSYFVTFLIVCVNAYLAYAFYVYKKADKAALKKTAVPCLAALLIFVANYIFGTVSMVLDEKGESDEYVAVCATQGNMLSQEKWSNGGLQSAVDKYTALTEQALGEGAEIIVFPETALAVDLREYTGLAESLATLAEENNCTLIVGAFDSEGEESYNAIYTFHPDGSLAENTYKKRHLVPFGEYLPAKNVFCTLFPFLDELNLFEDELTAGANSENAETEYGEIGFLICFDSVYEELALESVADGAELLAVSTNDSWFLDSSAIFEHNGQSVLRAVETRRYVVRAANTGMSSIITPRGEITKSLQPLCEGQITDLVVFRDDMTFYAKCPSLFIVICHIFVYGCLFAPLIEKIICKIAGKMQKRLAKNKKM